MILPLQMLYFEDLSVGLTETLRKKIDSADVVGFAEVTGDRNPIHLSEHFAARTPFGTRIAHGLYTASLISAVLGTRLPGPGAVYISQTQIGTSCSAVIPRPGPPTPGSSRSWAGPEPPNCSGSWPKTSCPRSGVSLR